MNDRRKVTAFIFARGGSKGLPRKNILPLSGKPLIAHTIELALQSTRIERVIVSTDDLEIAEISRAAGADVPFMRPVELATDEAPEWLAWQHALNYLEAQGSKVDIFLSLPATAPLRSIRDVECCLNVFMESNVDIVITVREAERNPYFNMVKKGDDGCVKLIMESNYSRRQDAPIMFDMTTVAYVSTPAYINRARGHFSGKVKAVLIPRERALDIDTQMDMIVAQSLLDSQLVSGDPKPI